MPGKEPIAEYEQRYGRGDAATHATVAQLPGLLPQRYRQQLALLSGKM